MPVYIDPTEAREDSRLSQDFISSSVVLPGLERFTGADFLITTLPGMSEITEAIPHQMMLESALEFGVLIQRKSGGDFVNSLPKLKEIQYRMLEWSKCGACWLLVTDLSFGPNGVLVDGQVSTATIHNVRSAMRWWQLRGGNVEVLPSDAQIASWCAEMCEFMQSAASKPVRHMVHKRPVQSLSMEEENWVTTGSAFPKNCGRSRREALYQGLVERGVDPTLGNAVYLLTSEQLETVAGWGSKTAKDTREWWGVQGVVRETPGFGSITLYWEDGLPFRIAGDGVEMVDEEKGVSVTFTNYNSLEVFRNMLVAAKIGE